MDSNIIAATVQSLEPPKEAGACSANVTPVVVTLHSVGRGKFTASLNGYPLVERASSSVIFAACRALVAAAVPDGPAQFRHETSVHAFDASVKSIHAAANLVTTDESASGLRIRSWRYNQEE